MAMDASEFDLLETNTSSNDSNPEASNATETSPSDDEILLEPTEEELKREQLKERMREVSYSLVSVPVKSIDDDVLFVRRHVV